MGTHITSTPFIYAVLIATPCLYMQFQPLASMWGLDEHTASLALMALLALMAVMHIVALRQLCQVWET
jgi:hypothetical protein